MGLIAVMAFALIIGVSQVNKNQSDTSRAAELFAQEGNKPTIPPESAILSFSNKHVRTGLQPFNLGVDVDTGITKVIAADVYVQYDSSFLKVVQVQPGTFFPQVTNAIYPGETYLAAYIIDPGKPVSGSGTIATLTFAPYKTGTTIVRFECDPTAVSRHISKVIESGNDAKNILICSLSGTSEITILPITPTPHF